MTIQNENTITLKTPSLLQRAWNWLVNFEQAMNYDPQEYAHSKIDYLNKQVTELNLRLDKIEVVKNGRNN